MLNPKVRLRVGHPHWQFWPILARFVDYSLFWGPRVLSTINEPWVHLRVGHQHSRFLSILARFMDYYSPFWGSKVISILVEPQGALTCRSSTLSVFVDSDPFRGLLLTVLGSESDFHGCLTPLSAYVSIINNRSFCPFLVRFLDYYSLFWGPKVIS